MQSPVTSRSRRSFLLTAASVGLPGLAGAMQSARRLRIVCAGGHPDDPESGSGGALARYAQEGHSVAILYLTRGEAGIAGKSHQAAAAIRTAECEAACRILGARPLFAGQIDGATEITSERSRQFTELLLAQEPDVILTQWPMDTHPDHQVAGILSFRAWRQTKHCQLYYYEVNLGSQTMGFRPTHYVDITAAREKKKAALFAHASQNGEAIYRQHHEIMESFRGREAGVQAAEAFVRLARLSANENRLL